MSTSVVPGVDNMVLVRLLQASWQAAVLGGIVFLVTWLLRGRLAERWRFGLWLLVFVRMALPILPPAPWGLFRTTLTEPERAVAAGGVMIPYEPTLERSHAIPASRAPEVVPAMSPLLSPTSEVRAEIPTPAPTGASRWLMGTWLSGVLFLLLRQGWLHVRLNRLLRTASAVADPGLHLLFQRCREELQLRRNPRLQIASDLAGPATCGAFRARILFPERLLPALSREEVRLVLLHELMHVRRWDILLDRLAVLLVAVHWFNPVAWLAVVCLRRERELACDEAVLSHLGTDEGNGYGQVLLKLADLLSKRVVLPGAVGVFVKDRSLIRRIHMIAHYRKPTAAKTLLSGLLLLLLGAFGLTSAAPSEKPANAEQRAPAKADATKGPVLAGICQDEEGQPLSGVQVVLYREDHRERKRERLRTVTTAADGRFDFGKLPPLPAEATAPAWGYGVVLTKQGRGSLVQSLFGGYPVNALQFRLRPAATLQGRVTDTKGNPVGGAQVWSGSLLTGPVEGVSSTRSDAEGRYAITDMGAWGPEVTKPQPAGNGAMTTLAGCYFDVLHPDYGHVRPLYRRMPDKVDVVLESAATLAGRVVDQVTGQPAAGVVVFLQGTNDSRSEQSQATRTDAQGHYRIPSLLAGKYNVWAEAPDRACAALASFVVEAGRTRQAPDLLLVEGGWLEGWLEDAGTGKPINGAATEPRLQVGLYGPSRPKSGACCQASPVDEHGRFRLHVAPGVNYPYLMTSDYWQRTQRREYFEQGIEVKPGEVVSIVFRILPTKPAWDPEPIPVRFPLPVAAERQAAAQVRQLGGWYDVDADKHVIEVNMVYHEAGGRRYDNRRIDTDAALRAVAAFSHLKRLFLHKGQATDEGLLSLTQSAELEVLLVWDANQLTDAGIAHLAGLPKLQNVHFSNGQLGDASLAVLSRLPSIQQLSLQGNAFSDDGLKFLADAKHLRSLWVGMNKLPLTDAGVAHLAGLTELQALDLQGALLTDGGVAALKDLKQLRTLYLDAAAREGSLTDACVEHLLGMTKLQQLGIQHTRLTEESVKRLLTLPELKMVQLSSTAISAKLQAQLEHQRPGLRLFLSGSRDDR